MRKTGAVLVATESFSGKETWNPMLPFGDSTIALHIITTLEELNVSPILIVTDSFSEKLEEHLFYNTVQFLKSERFEETQMAERFKMGARAIAGECQRILFLPMNLPAILPSTYRQMLMVDAKYVRAVYEGTSAFPILLYCEAAEQFWKQDGKGVPITHVEVKDEGVVRGVNTKEEYEKLIQWNYERGGGYPIHPLVRVCLTANKVFFGPGTAQLLENIEKTGSIQEACVQMEMSYSKGSRLIKKAERQLGFPVTERRAGGLGGGGTMLTREGKRLLKQYKSLVEEVQKSADNLYQDYFGKGIRGKQ